MREGERECEIDPANSFDMVVPVKEGGELEEVMVVPIKEGGELEEGG